MIYNNDTKWVQGEEIDIVFSGKTMLAGGSYTLSITRGKVETTNAASSSGKEYIYAPLYDWSVSCDSMVTRSNSATTWQFQDFITYIKTSKIPITVLLKSKVTGDKYESGSCLIESLDFKGGNDGKGELIKFSVKLQGTGDLTTMTAS